MRTPALITVTLLLTLTACGGGGGTPPTATPPVHEAPQSSPVGTPVGTPTRQTIGVAGGSLSTPDGKVRLDIPAGALSADQTVSVQEISNTAPAGAGRAYRLTPEGLTFAKPVRLTFGYSDEDTVGSAPQALSVGYQDHAGVWRMYREPTRDLTARTISVETNHFSDWSKLQGMQLQPLQAEVRVGQSVNLAVVSCTDDSDLDPDELTVPMPAGSACGPAVTAFTARNWSVNGAAGGGGGGTVVDAGGRMGRAVYTAPATKPARNPVAVSVAVNDLSEGDFTLVSNVTIKDPAAAGQGTLDLVYSGAKDGTAEFETTHEEFLGQYTYTVTGVDTATPDFTLLKTGGTGSYTYRYDRKFDRTEQVFCSDLHPRETLIEKNTETVRDGGESTRDDRGLRVLKVGGTYTLQLTPHTIPYKGTDVTWRFYKGACNPFSDTPADGSTSTSNRWGNFEPRLRDLQGQIDPQDPDHLQGSATWKESFSGVETTVRATWNITRGP
ncbi:hypothetical protein [Deinococcus pimensis]|uniref:hypothetical protein n=1 Tax=Deinococcus pimensis TaxID=309888 RepID=UPI0004B5F78B|nr:hypothetical protein [Deinococcus pimensis]